MSGLGFVRGKKGRSRRRPAGRPLSLLAAGVLAAAGTLLGLWLGLGKSQTETERQRAAGRQEAEEGLRKEAYGSAAGGQAMEEEKLEEIREYEAFLGRVGGIRSREEIGDAGLFVVEDQIFLLEAAGRGEVLLIPALDLKYRRMVLFFAEAGDAGEIIFWTEQLEANSQAPGKLKQGCRDVAAVSFPDIDGDGRQDVVLITVCNALEDGAGASYKVGDVLFQGQDGFYRDWRLSGRINRFGMNKSVRQILFFAAGGEPVEALYTAATRKELEQYGFVEEPGYASRAEFEKLGELLVVPGYYKLAEYHIFMVYLVNKEGRIAWNFQPMGEYENLYEILGIACRDIDGDGLKDVVTLARYSYDTPSGEMVTEKGYTIYYQRTGGFVEDTELKSVYQCGEETTMEELVVLARSYWGWGEEND